MDFLMIDVYWLGVIYVRTNIIHLKQKSYASAHLL